MQFLKIKNWERHQHYKDRDPKWIKLYQDILTSQTWVVGDDASRTLAISLMLLAAKTGNRIPMNAAYIKRVAYLNSEPDFSSLLATDFIEIIEESGNASDVLAERYRDASLEKRREEKNRKETPLAADAPRRQQKKSIVFDFQSGNFKGITEDDELRWQEAYPAVPIPPAIAQAAAWAKANPANRKSNWERFLVNWFNRAQQTAPRVR